MGSLSEEGIPYGVELDKLAIWRDPETGNVIIQVPLGREQVVFTAVQWAQAVEFLGDPTRCTCSDVGGPPLCPVHDRAET